jgi:SpoU rRNA methylase family enzyme
MLWAIEVAIEGFETHILYCMHLNDVVQIYRPTGIFIVTESTGTRNNIRTSAAAGVDGRHWIVTGSLSHLIWVEQEPPTGRIIHEEQTDKQKQNK